jgi:hypothetical protein
MSQEDEILKYNLELLEKLSKEGEGIYIDENGVVWVKRKESKKDGETVRTSSDSI